MGTAWVILALGVATIGSAVAHLVHQTRRTLALALIGVCVTFLGGMLGTVLGLIQAFGAVENMEPSRKAAALAQGISQAMSCTAFALTAVVLWIPPFVIAEIRRRRPPPRLPGPGLRLEP